jgi:hypothetical protein
VASTFRAEDAVHESAEEINASAGVPPTLQGGSGTDGGDPRRAVAAAEIRIIHMNAQLGIASRLPGYQYHRTVALIVCFLPNIGVLDDSPGQKSISFEHQRPGGHCDEVVLH